MGESEWDPNDKKVETMVNMMPPMTTNQVREFMGLVRYYRYMWERWSHLIQPLTELTSNKVKLKCTDVEQK